MAVDLTQLSDAELKALAVRLEARRSPASMAKYLWPREYTIRDTHRLIGDHLARMKEPGGKRRVMIFTPPRAGKSQLVSKALPVWWLTHHPTHRVVAAAYGVELAKKWGRDVRNLVREHGPRLGIELAPDQRAAQVWSLASGGGMQTTSVGAGLTGHDADLLVCDDPHKNREEAESRLFRDRVWDWWSSTFLTRRNGPSTPIVLVLTRWHEDDLAGRLLNEEPDEWTVLRLPAFCDTHDDPLGRHIGEPLPHPAISDPEDLAAWWSQQKKDSSVRDWYSLFMADPQPVEGALLTLEQIEPSILAPGHTPPEAVKTAVGVDPSGTQRGDDAGIVVGFLGVDDKVYVTADRTRQYSPTGWAREAMLAAYEVNANVVFIETNFGGDMCEHQLLSAWRDLEDTGMIDEGSMIPEIKQVRAKHGKRIRAEPVAQKWLQGQVRLLSGLDKLVKEWSTWQTGAKESPGRIDAMTYLVQGLLPANASGPARVWEPPSGNILATAWDVPTMDII